MPRRTRSYLACLLFSTLLLSGCAIKLLYNQLDWLIPWYLSDYVEMTSTQREFFSQRLDAHLQWHKRDQLPAYAQLLNDLALDLEQGLTETQIDAYQTRFERITRAMIERVAPDLIELMARSTDEQVEDLFLQLSRDNQDYREDYLEADETRVRERRADEVIRNVERWTGKLSRSQRQMVTRWSQEYPLMTRDFYEARLDWQLNLRQALAIRQDRPQFQQRVMPLLDGSGYRTTPEFDARLKHNRVLLTALYQEINASLSQSQRQRAIQTMRDYARDFAELAAQ
jgi:hypothetical protein